MCRGWTVARLALDTSQARPEPEGVTADAARVGTSIGRKGVVRTRVTGAPPIVVGGDVADAAGCCAGQSVVITNRDGGKQAGNQERSEEQL